MCLADYCQADGRDWHGIAAIMGWTCLGRRTVIDALRQLEARGLIHIERTRGKSNKTTLQLDQIEAQAVAEHLGKPRRSRTSAEAAPVRETHETSALAAPLPVHQPPPPVQPLHPKHQEATQKHQEAKPRRRVAPLEMLPAIDLPEWLPAVAWRSYLGARASMRKPMGRDAQEIALKKLAHFRSEGHDVEAILEASVMNGWKGLFAPKEARQASASVGSDDMPAWALKAGFKNRFDAENEGCNERNAGEFHHGKRLENA
jgi:hypothetical protein